ncbi:alpha-glucosidase [Propionibacteriaceae bacterium G1746]
MAGTHGRVPGWWRSAVIYQVYPRSFCDSDGDGVGDLQGLISKLDHLSALGVDALWLGPVFRSPHDDNGYDIADYQDIDPLFGTLADMDELITGLHARGIKLVIDLVVNHTSDEHPWFQASRRRQDSKDDWYWWADPKPGHVGGQPGAEPSTAQSVFSGSAWQWCPVRQQYYLHLFSRKQPDLNWQHPEVRRAVHEMMRWWVARGVDGFRMDVINLIAKQVPLTDQQPANAALDPAGPFVGGPRMDEFLHEMNQAVLAENALLAVGEAPGVTLEDASRYTDPARDELDMVFQFEHVNLDEQPGGGKWALKPLHLPDLKANLARWQTGLEGRGWNSLYWNNHDQPRIVSRWGDDSPEFRVASAKTLGTVLHLLKGTPYVYQGEEIGMTNAQFTRITDYRDLETLNHHTAAIAAGADEAALLEAYRVKGRDNARYPMQWDATATAGFTTGTPWLPVHPNHVDINVAAAVADPASVWHHYRRLIELRHTSEVVREGVFDLLEPGHEQLFCYTRTLGDQKLLVLANMSSRECALPGALQVQGTMLVASHPAVTTADITTLQPWESRVVKL